MIVEKLNTFGKVNESLEGEENRFPGLEEAGFLPEEEDEFAPEFVEEDEFSSEFTEGDDEFAPEFIEGDEFAPEFVEGQEDCIPCGDTPLEFNDEFSDEQTEEEEFYGDTETELSESINKLIEEAKKRKVSESSDLNFLKFLNKSQVASFYALGNEEQEDVKLHINERSYFTQKDVLSLISEALSTNSETLEERVIRLMPDNVKPLWNQLNESSKKSVLSQARLYPEDVLKTENQIEHFWATRNIKTNEASTKKLVTESLIQEDRLSDNDVSLIMERFRRV